MKLTHFYQSFLSQQMELDQLNGPESLRKVEKFLILLRLESGADRVSGQSLINLSINYFR